jgi:hypothetical protein
VRRSNSGDPGFHPFEDQFGLIGPTRDRNFVMRSWLKRTDGESFAEALAGQWSSVSKFDMTGSKHAARRKHVERGADLSATRDVSLDGMYRRKERMYDHEFSSVGA